MQQAKTCPLGVEAKGAQTAPRSLGEHFTVDKASKNSALDWKITMLDGTQTVELNMSDELGKQKKTHVCLFCGKIYNRKYGLKIHLRTHTGYKPLKCKVCSRPFSDPSNLNKHVRLHSQGDTPYRCPYCGKILVRKRDLDRHIMSRHSGKEMDALQLDPHEDEDMMEGVNTDGDEDDMDNEEDEEEDEIEAEGCPKNKLIKPTNRSLTASPCDISIQKIIDSSK